MADEVSLKGEFSSDGLKHLFQMLSEERQDRWPEMRRSKGLTAAEQALLDNDSISMPDFVDLVIATEHRGMGGAGYLAPLLARTFKIPVVALCRKPSHVEDSVYLVDGFVGTDAVALLIIMEQLGLLVYPEQLVAKLQKRLLRKSTLTESEYRIWTYDSSRGRQKITLKSDVEYRPGLPDTNTHRDQAGNRLTLTLLGDAALALEVRGARYREVKTETKVCDYCGFGYLPCSRIDRQAHRRVHRNVELLLEPRPNKLFAARLLAGSDGERVGPDQPLWMHREVLRRASRFRSDFGYDFIQWPGSGTEKASSDWRGHLIPAAQDGTIAGACAFNRRPEADQYGSEWAMAWIWLAPSYRRLGLVRERWAKYLELYGDFWIERPLSHEMEAFIKVHGSEMQKRWLKETGA